MGLAKRVIPTLLYRGAQLFKGKQFSSWRSIGHARQAVLIHNSRGVDELIMLDITATPEGREPDYKTAFDLSTNCFCPLTIGGGISKFEHAKKLFEAGADKIAVGSKAFDGLIEDISEKYGKQAVVAALDVKGRGVYTHCGQKLSRFDPVGWAKELERSGAGEILLTSIEREGTMNGFDLELIRKVSGAVDIPVIAHGGCGMLSHALEAIHAGASAVAIGSMFAFTEETPKTVACYLRDNGVEVRL
jgi:cyclase